MQANGHAGAGGGQAGALYRSFRTRRGAASALGEINVTPLVDVVLVLLLVFMITAPMMSRGIDLSLPVADQPDNSPEDRLTVSVTAEQRVYIGDRPVSLLLLEDRLRGIVEGRSSKVVYLRADEALRYGNVVAVIDIMKRAGVEQVGIVYVLPKEKGQR